jgi:hypothetical protein
VNGGDVLTDQEIADLGYERTSRAWVPVEAAAEHRRTGLTPKQWRRFTFVTARGWHALPEWSARTYALAACLGKIMNVDKSFTRIRHRDEALCVVLHKSHRDRVIALLGRDDKDPLRPWRRAVRSWEQALMGHACSRDTVTIFFSPESICPACETAVPRRVKQPSDGGSSAISRLESVPRAGDATRDGKGDAALAVAPLPSGSRVANSARRDRKDEA